VDQVVFERNIVRHSASAVSILGSDNNHPSRQASGITIRNNLFADIDSSDWGGGGYAFQLVNGPRDIVFDHNTIIQEHGNGILQVEGPPVFGFAFTNNIALHHTYGIKGADRASGADTISAYFPASEVVNNAIAGAEGTRYPAGNLLPSSADFAGQFEGYASGNYRLRSDSPWRGAASDGRDLGADLDDEPRRPPTRPRQRE